MDQDEKRPLQGEDSLTQQNGVKESFTAELAVVMRNNDISLAHLHAADPAAPHPAEYN
jgi:hypothetical protein